MDINYKNKKERPKLETLKSLYSWAESSEVAIQAVKPIIQHLVASYLRMDEFEEEKEEELTFVLKEMIWLEKRLEEELTKGQELEIVIH